jgi:hypothetical protein
MASLKKAEGLRLYRYKQTKKSEASAEKLKKENGAK